MPSRNFVPASVHPVLLASILLAARFALRYPSAGPPLFGVDVNTGFKTKPFSPLLMRHPWMAHLFPSSPDDVGLYVALESAWMLINAHCETSGLGLLGGRRQPALPQATARSCPVATLFLLQFILSSLPLFCLRHASRYATHLQGRLSSVLM